MAIGGYSISTKSPTDTMQSGADSLAVISKITNPSIYGAEFPISQDIQTGVKFMNKQKNVRAEIKIETKERHFATRITYAIHTIREAIRTKDYRSIWVKL